MKKPKFKKGDKIKVNNISCLVTFIVNRVLKISHTITIKNKKTKGYHYIYYPENDSSGGYSELVLEKYND
ncbi:MAG: hypothetical protein M0R03_19555 [Novosphingobium sp.]|nr:hypothetical protein [Novosphingobium sp.]